MNTEQQQSAIKDVSDTVRVPIIEYVTAIWERRSWLATVVGVGVMVVAGFSFLIPNKYTSTARLMPPDWRPPSGGLMLGALQGGGSSPGGSLAGNLLGNSTPSATYIGILQSRTVQDSIVNSLDLRRVYHCKLDVDARQALAAETQIVDDRKSGIINITVTDRDRYRARDIAQAYVQELDNLVESLSSSSARRERIFLEGRLKSIKADLDTSSRALSEFSSRNATLDLQRQGEATVVAAGNLEGELTTAQSQLSGLKAAYSNDNVRVREAQRRVDVLRAQLRKMTGTGMSSTGAAGPDSDQTLPSVRELPVLGLTYYDLSRELTLDEQLYEVLSKQYETARVQEAEQILPIEVLDAPAVPERKSGPHRLNFVLVGFFLSLFAGIAWIVATKRWELTDNSHPVKALAIVLLRRKSG